MSLNLLRRGVTELGLDLSSQQEQQLMDYLALLKKWNRAINLTAISKFPEMVQKHLLDSLAILPYVHGQRCLDVGSGAGLPGIVLSIVDPTRQFYLLDSKSKKTQFLRQVSIELGLANVEVVNDRVEHFTDQEGFDCIISRAFTALPNMVQLSQHLVRPDGKWLAMTGQLDANHVSALEQQGFTVECVALQVPFLEAARHAVVISPPRGFTCG